MILLQVAAPYALDRLLAHWERHLQSNPALGLTPGTCRVFTLSHSTWQTSEQETSILFDVPGFTLNVVEFKNAENISCVCNVESSVKQSVSRLQRGARCCFGW